jgi:hypothetical protein
LFSQPNDRSGQRGLILPAVWLLALGGAVLADHMAGSAHRDAEIIHRVIDAGMTARGA